jgi:hypothetical protein
MDSVYPHAPTKPAHPIKVVAMVSVKMTLASAFAAEPTKSVTRVSASPIPVHSSLAAMDKPASVGNVPMIPVIPFAAAPTKSADVHKAIVSPKMARRFPMVPSIPTAAAQEPPTAVRKIPTATPQIPTVQRQTPILL